VKIVVVMLAAFAVFSFICTIWQWLSGWRFPLHVRRRIPAERAAPVTLLKPLKGCDAATEKCLRSWLVQDYAGEIQVLFGVDSEADPACEIVRRLLAEAPQRDARLVICSETFGVNAKASKLAQLANFARHECLVISDADVFAPPDLLTQLTTQLLVENVALVSCFYRLAEPATEAMRWEAVAMNADFWSQVLQSRTLAPLDFALGAVMAVRQKELRQIGGFTAFADCLADDYELGHRLAARGGHIEISPVVVTCWDEPMTWRGVWRHQLRWARTIRVCRPVSYFFSILGNATLWPLLWLIIRPHSLALGFFCLALLVRVMSALHLQWRLNHSPAGDTNWWLVPLKDLLQGGIWLRAFTGNRIHWRGEVYRLKRDGSLVPEAANS